MTKAQRFAIARKLQRAQAAQLKFWDAQKALEALVTDRVMERFEDEDMQTHDLESLLALMREEGVIFRTCDELNAEDGEGYDGECGACADKRSKEKAHA